MAPIIDGIGPLLPKAVPPSGVEVDVFRVVSGAGPDPAPLEPHAPGRSPTHHRMERQMLTPPAGIGRGQAPIAGGAWVCGAERVSCRRREVQGVGRGDGAVDGVQIPGAREVSAFHPEAIHGNGPVGAELHPPSQGGLPGLGLLKAPGKHAAFLPRGKAPLERGDGGSGRPLTQGRGRELGPLEGHHTVAIGTKLHRIRIDGVGEDARVEPPAGANRGARGREPVQGHTGLDVVQIGGAFAPRGDVVIVPAEPAGNREI